MSPFSADSALPPGVEAVRAAADRLLAMGPRRAYERLRERAGSERAALAAAGALRERLAGRWPLVPADGPVDTGRAITRPFFSRARNHGHFTWIREGRLLADRDSRHQVLLLAAILAEAGVLDRAVSDPHVPLDAWIDAAHPGLAGLVERVVEVQRRDVRGQHPPTRPRVPAGEARDLEEAIVRAAAGLSPEIARRLQTPEFLLGLRLLLGRLVAVAEDPDRYLEVVRRMRRLVPGHRRRALASGWPLVEALEGRERATAPVTGLIEPLAWACAHPDLPGPLSVRRRTAALLFGASAALGSLDPGDELALDEVLDWVERLG